MTSYQIMVDVGYRIDGAVVLFGFDAGEVEDDVATEGTKLLAVMAAKMWGRGQARQVMVVRNATNAVYSIEGAGFPDEDGNPGGWEWTRDPLLLLSISPFLRQ